MLTHLFVLNSNMHTMFSLNVYGEDYTGSLVRKLGGLVFPCTEVPYSEMAHGLTLTC